jgi:tetratricopeptide (TPR) repeat protein
VVAERRQQRPLQAAGPRPPRMARPKLRKPHLPEGQRPFIDKDALRDLRAAARKEDLDDVIKAFALAGDAIDEDRLDDAIELLEWAKAQAARSAVLREALGISLYLKGDFAKAHSELLTYRRLSNRHDQNHLLADCARAAGRHDKVAEYVEEMLAAKAPRDRSVEGLIVLAGDRADRGDLRGALDTRRRADLEPQHVEPYHARQWYAAADFCARMGDQAAEREFLEAIAAVDEDFLDVNERLGAPGV